MMRFTAMLAASAAVLAVFTLPRDGRGADAAITAAPAQAAAQEDFRWSGQVARGDEIEIRGLLGSVRAEPSSGDRVEVVGRRIGRDAEQVRIEVVEGGDGVVICTVYPRRESRRRGGQERETRRNRSGGPCGENNSGELDVDSDEARIDFTVRVPAGVRFTARTVDGDIEARGLRGPVDAASVAGDVRVSTTGTARAATVSGNVDATFGATDGSDMEFASVSGNVIVRVAESVGARVQANTLSGRIQSDFDLRIRPGGDDDDDDDAFTVRIGQRASGTIGGGGPELSLSTVSGNIRVLRGG